MRRAVRRHPVAAFFVLAFAVSWAEFGLLYALLGAERLASSRLFHVPFAWGPPLAAVIVTWSEGRLGAWLRAVADPRARPAWYVLALLLPFLFSDTRSVLAWLAGVPPGFAVPPAEVLESFALTLFLAGSLEEFGWRGFAQYRLQERRDALVAAVVVGVAFGLWHLPWVLLGGAGYGGGGAVAVAAMVLFGVLASVVFAWLFNGSGGTVPVVMLAHAGINTGTILEPAGPLPGWLPDTQLGLFLWLGVAVVLVAVYGRRRLAPGGPGPFPGGA